MTPRTSLASLVSLASLPLAALSVSSLCASMSSLGCGLNRSGGFLLDDYFVSDGGSKKATPSDGDRPADPDTADGAATSDGADGAPGERDGACDGRADGDGGAFVAPGIGLPGDPAGKDGDLRTGILGREISTGDLWYYPWSATGGFLPRVRIGVGWSAVDRIVGVGDLTGDEHPDILARDATNGSLWLYPGDAKAGLGPGRYIGDGAAMSELAGAGDLSGDGHPGIVGTDSDGALWIYAGDGSGGLESPRKLAALVAGIDAFVPIGDLDADGRADLLGREASTGALWLYPGDGAGGLGPRRAVGNGWKTMDSLAGAGDFNGDGTPDLVAREVATMKLWLYPAGVGAFGSRVEIGHGWGSLDLVTSARAGGP